jgi:hypothetical protein
MTTSIQPAFSLYACLPFVELEYESPIQMGPVLFWPSSKYQEYMPAQDIPLFQEYLHSVSQVKVLASNNPHALLHTTTLAPHTITCVSLDQHVKPELKELALIDAIYLLYFACTFRNLYYTTEIPSFQAFRKMAPASAEFIQHKSNWEHQYISEIQREDPVCLHLFDLDICNGLGKALEAVYGSSSLTTNELHFYKRLIRSIRYLIDRFFQRFVNLFDKGLHLSSALFEPEDIIFLASSFEALFDLQEHQTASDFKHKLRPLLHLKYSTPIEVFWKWADDFYEAKRKIVHGGDNLDLIFQANPNFQVSPILIGMKLLIYAVYYQLFRHQLIPSQSLDPYTPPDFKWIHPEELLLFFWPEEKILAKLALFLNQLVEHPDNQELQAEVKLLSHLFVAMYERYHQKKTDMNNGLLFIPTPIESLKPDAGVILEILDREPEEQREMIHSLFPSSFKTYLKNRINTPSI